MLLLEESGEQIFPAILWAYPHMKTTTVITTIGLILIIISLIMAVIKGC